LAELLGLAGENDSKNSEVEGYL